MPAGVLALWLSIAILCHHGAWGEDPLEYNITLLPETAVAHLRCDSKAESALRFDISDLLQKFGSTDFDLGHSIPIGRSLFGAGRPNSFKQYETDPSTNKDTKQKQSAKSLTDTIRNVREGLETAGVLAKKIICVGLRLKLAEVTIPQNLADIACSCITDDDMDSNCAFIELIATQLICQATRCPMGLIPVAESVGIDGDMQEGSMQPPYLSDDHIALVDFNITPAVMDSDVVMKERFSYSIAVRSTFLIYREVESELCNTYEPAIQPAKNWELLVVFYANESNHDQHKTQRLQLAQLRRRPNKHNPQKVDFLLAVRGTLTPAEWQVNFAYSHTTLSFPGSPQMRVHRGFAYVAQEIWEPLSLILSSHANDGTLGRVTFTGHSLGAGIASIVGMHASVAFTQKPNIILFGSPRTGDEAFMMELAKRTRLRSVEAAFDPVPFIPCKTMPGCPISGHRIAESADINDYSPSLVTCAASHGRIQLLPHDLTSHWTELGNHHRNIPAWHVCAYLCWASRIANQTEQACYASTSGKPIQSLCPYFIKS